MHVMRGRIDAARELHVLGDVDHHRAGPSARGDVKCLVQHAAQIVDAFDEIIMLGAVAGDADRVAFLKGVEPMRCVGTCPVMQTSGMLSISASVSR